MRNIINSTWDTLDMPTKASIMKESLQKGITDIDIIRKNYDSKYQNVDMLPQVEDSFSKEQLYDLYNKVEGNSRNNSMYPSNSYGNLFKVGGDKGDTRDTLGALEGFYPTEVGELQTYRGKSKLPGMIQLTKEEIEELKKSTKHQILDYSNTNNKEIPFQNPTQFIYIPRSYVASKYPSLNLPSDDATANYYYDTTIEPDEKGYITLNKLDLDSPEGKEFIHWKESQEKLKGLLENPDPYGTGQPSITLDTVGVVASKSNGKNQEKQQNINRENVITPLTYNRGQGESPIIYSSSQEYKGSKESLPKADETDRQGILGGSPYGEKTGVELIREYDANGNPIYYYPGYGSSNNGYYYPNSKVTINWPSNYNLPDYSGEYDATHDGVPVEQFPFIEDDKLNLKDLLAWIQTQMNNRNYPLGEDSEFLLPKRSKQINPQSVTPLIEESHIFKNKKSKGGKMN